MGFVNDGIKFEKNRVVILNFIGSVGRQFGRL